MIGWAIAQGAALWALHGLLPKGDAAVLWPLYAVVLAVPPTLQLLAAHRARRLLRVHAAALAMVFAAAAAYAGHASLGENRGRAAMALGVLLSCSWFVLLPFAEQRLASGTWARDYARLFATAWRHAFQLLLAGLFAGLFWALLFLLAGLFHPVRQRADAEALCRRNHQIHQLGLLEIRPVRREGRRQRI